MGKEVNSQLVPALRLGENSVQQVSSDSAAPPFGSDVQKAEEAAAGYDRALPVLLAQSPGGGHRDRLWSLGGDEKPRARVMQACPDVAYAGGLAGPGALTAGQIRPLVDGNCGVDISRPAESDQNHALNVQPACRNPGRREAQARGFTTLATCKAGGECAYGPLRRDGQSHPSPTPGVASRYSVGLQPWPAT
jgi:hypothetical protein